ncbi:MAG: ZIP family metal transporter, partial [Clostridia bacterium]|nr:ZIP family metal transporter [Clostridia bacterium]
MVLITAQGLLIPFVGTSLGALCVFFLKKGMSRGVQNALNGFAAGVMIAASVWSLLIPAIERVPWGRLSFIPAAVGLFIGMAFLLLTDRFEPFEIDDGMRKTKLLVFAVILHNIPEGMAVGAVLAGLLSGDTSVSVSEALALSIGIAIQNLPEGAIVSMPVASMGKGRGFSCFVGILSGVVEPLAGLLTVLLSGIAVPVLPYLLGFAAGAMLYVAVRELIPESCENSLTGTALFMLGFSVTMILDV